MAQVNKDFHRNIIVHRYQSCYIIQSDIDLLKGQE